MGRREISARLEDLVIVEDEVPPAVTEGRNSQGVVRNLGNCMTFRCLLSCLFAHNPASFSFLCS